MSIKFKIAGQEYTVDGAAEEDTLLRIEALFKKAMNTSGSVFDPKAQQNFAKAIKDSTKSSTNLNDSFDDLNNSVEDADKSFDDVVKHEKDREKQRESSMNDFKKAVATNIVATSQYFAHSIQDAAHSLIDSLSHASSPEDGVMAFAKVIDTTINVISDGIKAVASAIPYIGTAIAGLTGAAAESAKFLNDFLAGQLVNVIQSYGKISSEGILLADGITELKQTANQAGVGIGDFSDALSRNATVIRNVGLGMTEGSQKFGQAIASLRNSTEGYSNKLFALGYNFQDQADIVAASMNNLARTTNVQKLNGDQIAQQSYEYAKNLKIISDITGQTAKQQMEAQQAANLNIAVQNKLAQLGPEAAEKFNQIIAATPESMRKAVEQQLVLGSVVDQQSAIIIANNKDAAEAIRSSVSILTDSSKTAAEAAQETVGRWADAGQSLQKNGVAIAAATADLAGVSGTAGELGKTVFNLNSELVKYSREGVAAAVDAEQKLTTNADSLTRNFATLSDDMLKFKSIIETDATNAVEGYSKILVKMADWIDKTLVKSESLLGINNPEDKGPPKEKDMGVWNSLMNAMISFFTGANPGPATMAARQAAANAPNVDVVPAFADGGIASGSKNGFSAMLHGTEAVVPLPNGNSIPVDINTDDLKRDNETRNANADHRNDLVDEKMLATLQALLNTQEDGNYYSKQNAGISNAQNNLLKNLVDQMTLNNELLNKIYKTSY
jgi:hypothetical protein